MDNLYYDSTTNDKALSEVQSSFQASNHGSGRKGGPRDQIPPVISNIPTGVYVQVPDAANSSVASWSVPTATDNSGVTPNRVSTHNPGDVFNLGKTTVTYTFTDGSGNAAMCFFYVTVARRATAVIVQMGQSAVSGVGRWNPIQATDNSGAVPTVTQTHRSGDTFKLGQTSVTYTFRDGAGNSAECRFTVNVIRCGPRDQIPPVISNIPTGVHVQVPDAANSSVASWSVPTATDNSGVTPNRVSTHNPGDVFNLGKTTVTYTFTDGSGNAAMCFLYVTVARRATAVIVQMGQSAVSGVGRWNPIQATDNSGAVPTVTQTHRSGDTFKLGQTSVTYTFRDGAGNSAECRFTVNVIRCGPRDQIPPVISNIPTGVHVQVPDAANSSVASWSVPTATDNSGVTPNRVSTHNPGDVFNLGKTTVTYTFTDGSGNAAMCFFYVTVARRGGPRDQIPPVISNIPTGVHVQVPDAANSSVASWSVPTATDNSGVTPNRVSTHNPGDVFNLGKTTVTYTFTDGSGNAAMCFFYVTVARRATAVIVQMGQSAVSGVGRWNPIQATDNSGAVPTVTQTHRSGDTFKLGQTSVTYTFRDGAGNSAECRFTVNVIRWERVRRWTKRPKPVIYQMQLIVAWLHGVFQQPRDNSGVTPNRVSTHNPGDVFNLGKTTVTYTFTDGSGNAAMCFFYVTVARRATAVIVQMGQSAVSGVGRWNPIQATDNSGAVPTVTQTHRSGDTFKLGQTSVTYTFRDGAGNSAECRFTVNVIRCGPRDQIPPVISNIPTGVHVQVPDAANSSVASWSVPTATDNSGVTPNRVSTHNPGDVFNLGKTTVTYTFTDGSGNAAMCFFYVTVARRGKK
ncbi:hyalin-like [Amphiura filiformis]|uniref:hyalin-like n=1 Tax=Amphiura filiformis TaxID=82378 RepID=UPI003B2126AB